MSVSVRTKALSSVGVIAAGVIAILINLLAARHYKRWDATRGRLYSLSQPTNFTLDSLERDGNDVELFVFIGGGDPLLSSIKQILVTYQSRAPKHLHVRYLDPDRDRAEFMRLQAELEVNAKAENGRILADAQIVARHGKRVWYVQTDDLVVLEEGDDGKVRPRVESALTSAIRAVLSTDRPRVCFTTGHGEAELDDPSESGISVLKNTLSKDNFQPVAIDVTRPDASFAGCAMIAIVSPDRPFRAAETPAIVDAVTKGASLLVAVSPEIDLETKSLRATGLADVAALGGVMIDDAVAVEQDPALRELDQIGLIFHARLHAHVTTDAIRRRGEELHGEIAILLYYARPLQKITVAGAPAQELLVTSDDSFAMHDVTSYLASKQEPHKAGTDRAGPLDIATATTRDKSVGGARVIIVGSTTPYLNAAYFDASPEMYLSRQLGLNWVSWLTARPPILDLPPKPSVQIAMHMTDEDLTAVSRYVLLYMPLATALIGGAVWMRRRATEGKRLRRPATKPGRKRE